MALGMVGGLSAVALLVVAGLGVVMSDDDDDAVSSDDVAAAIAVVTAHNEAQNVADGEMMRATRTDDAAWVADEEPPTTMEEYIKVVQGYGPVEQTLTGEPTVVRDPNGSEDLQVSVPMSFDSSSGRQATLGTGRRSTRCTRWAVSGRSHRSTGNPPSRSSVIAPG